MSKNTKPQTSVLELESREGNTLKIQCLTGDTVSMIVIRNIIQAAGYIKAGQLVEKLNKTGEKHPVNITLQNSALTPYTQEGELTVQAEDLYNHLDPEESFKLRQKT